MLFIPACSWCNFSSVCIYISLCVCVSKRWTGKPVGKKYHYYRNINCNFGRVMYGDLNVWKILRRSFIWTWSSPLTPLLLGICFGVISFSHFVVSGCYNTERIFLFSQGCVEVMVLKRKGMGSSAFWCRFMFPITHISPLAGLYLTFERSLCMEWHKLIEIIVTSKNCGKLECHAAQMYIFNIVG